MKINFSKLALVIATSFTTSSVYAQGPDLQTFLVGEWRQVTRSPVGTQDVIVVVLRPDHTFKTTIAVNGNFNDPAWQAGTWEIRNGNQLWIHNQAWFPMRTIDPYSDPMAPRRTIPVRLQPWQSWTIRVIDANHTTNESGIVATRIRG